MSGPVYYLLALIFLLLLQIHIPITSASSAPGSYRACNCFRAWHQQPLFTWNANTSDTQQLVLFSFRVQFKFHFLTEAFPNNPSNVAIWSFSITSPYFNLLNSIPLSDLLYLCICLSVLSSSLKLQESRDYLYGSQMYFKGLDSKTTPANSRYSTNICGMNICWLFLLIIIVNTGSFKGSSRVMNLS